jgi:hypothetical protein
MERQKRTTIVEPFFSDLQSDKKPLITVLKNILNCYFFKDR